MYIMSNNTEIEKAGKTNRKDKVLLIVGLVLFLSALAAFITCLIHLNMPISDAIYPSSTANLVMWFITVVVGVIIISYTKKGSNGRIIAILNLVVGLIFLIVAGFFKFMVFMVS